MVRRLPPRAPGRVVGVACERGLITLGLGREASAGLPALLEALDEHGAGGKQLRAEPGGASLVLSLENLPDYPAVRDDLGRRFPDVVVQQGVGAVSAIGTGINASHRNLRACLDVIRGLDLPLRGLSTSSFRISVLIDESGVDAAVRALHRELLEPAG